jgi:hypothetical protein
VELPWRGVFDAVMSARRVVTALAALLATFLVMTLGNTGGGPPSAHASAAPTAPLASLSVSAVIKALSAEGVGVYASPTSKHPLHKITAPVTPLRVLRSQAEADSAQIAAAGGTSGVDLDSLVSMPANAPPFAYLMAAYAEGDSTAGEVLAGKLIGAQALADPETAVYPSLVETLFAADAVRTATTARRKKHGSGRAAAASPQRAHEAGAVGTACASLANWTSSAASRFFSALTVGPPSNSTLAFLTGIWNHAVSQASAAISGIASALTSQLTSFIRNSLGVVGVAALAVSALQNLHLTLTAAPAYNKFAIDPAPGNTGTVTATLGSASGFNYPADLAQCASSFGLTLPSLNDVSGDKVAWTTQNVGSGAALATITNEQDTLGSNHSATLSYATGQESADQAARGTPITTDYLYVTATVTPSVFKKLLDLVEGLTLGRVPGGVAAVGPIVSALKTAVLNQIAKLVQPHDARYIEIDHHAQPAPLAAVSCATLLSTADFPDAVTIAGGAVTPTSLAGASTGSTSTCIYNPLTDTDDTQQLDGGQLSLHFWPTSAAASQDFTFIVSGPPPSGVEVSVLSGIGDGAVESFSELDPDPSDPDSLTQEAKGIYARVANVVIFIQTAAVGLTPVDPAPLASKVIAELCPMCVFPTSGA